jgi:penicillin G amidase
VRVAVRRSLGDAWIAMSVALSANRERWTWGNLLHVRFAPLPPGGRMLPARTLGPYPYAGDATSVRVAAYRGLRSFEAEVVATYRFVADASNLDQALTLLAPGQSEHPGHPHAADGLGRWLEGRPTLLSTSAPVIEDGEVARLTLEPAP